MRSGTQSATKCMLLDCLPTLQPKGVLNMKIRNMCKKYGSKIAVGSAAFLGSIAAAHAEGDGASAVFTALGAKVTAYEGYAWTLLAIVMTAIIAIKLFKKFANKAT